MKRAGAFFAALTLVLLLASNGSSVSMDPSEFQFLPEFVAILDNIVLTHWRDPGGEEGGLWLNREGNPEKYYGKGTASLFGSDLLYNLGLDPEIADEDTPLPKAELVHRGNRTIDHIVYLYDHFLLYFLNPDRYELELLETGMALPGLLNGMQFYSGDQNRDFPFEERISTLSAMVTVYSRVEGNFLATGDLGTIGALGTTSYYDLVFARIASDRKRAGGSVRNALEQLAIAARYRTTETDVGHENHVIYLHRPETPVIDAWANPSIVSAAALAYQMTGDDSYLNEAASVEDAIRDHLWDGQNGWGYFFDEATPEIHLAANNVTIQALLHLYDAAGRIDGSEAYLDQARAAIAGVIRRLYSPDLRVCLHDDVAMVDPTYYCTGCNLQFLRNILEFNRLAQKGPEGVIGDPFPSCAMIWNDADPPAAKVVNLSIVLLPLFVIAARGMRSRIRRPECPRGTGEE